MYHFSLYHIIIFLYATWFKQCLNINTPMYGGPKNIYIQYIFSPMDIIILDLTPVYR